MTDYSFKVLIPEGLHARPCAKIIEILKPFEPVRIVYNNHEIKVLSILEMLLQKISYGSSVAIISQAILPQEALKKLESIFSNTQSPLT